METESMASLFLRISKRAREFAMRAIASGAVLGPAVSTATAHPGETASPRARQAAATLGDASSIRGSIAWHRGTFDEALARARAESRQVFVVFRRNDCKLCDEFFRNTLTHPAVVAEFADSVCVSIDGLEAAGGTLVARYGVAEYPTAVWLSPDGVARDRVVGVLGPTELLHEAQRIRADRETIPELRRRIAADENNVDLRWRLAQKLRASGDGVGAEEQIAKIKQLDPSGRSKPMRLMRLDELRVQVRRTYDEVRGAFDVSPFARALEHEADPEVLFRGWSIVADFEVGALARIQQARDSTPVQAAAARARRRAALQRAWPHCPRDEMIEFGNALAWSFYESTEELGPEEKEFALQVAARAAELAPEAPAVVDTLACCLWMNGKKDEALAAARRCVELDPKNDAWRERVEEFTP
ncbi:MAG: thioredoxin family protein [Planctomycetes bacterium]|nr:thioredoxin family protein [Planctomycetota bacterium]